MHDRSALPDVAQPGDRVRRDWTECDEKHCTDHHREDRYQREDASAEGTDPDAGEGPYAWIPIDWSSRQCTPFIECREKAGSKNAP